MASLQLTRPPRPSKGSSAIGTFDLPSSPSSHTDSDVDDDAPLPFPAALPRSDFLAKDFRAAEYLSALPHRHQTLEDLRSELRDRSSAISAELLELVNANYTAFLSLGNDLKGGDERVEDVRVALLGFRRAIEEVKAKVYFRRTEVHAVSTELGKVRRGIEIGRRMIELDERLGALEDRLSVPSLALKPTEGDNLLAVDSDDDDDDGDGGDDEDGKNAKGLIGSSPGMLTTLVRDLVVIESLAVSIGNGQPFVVRMEERILRCRNTILLDLGNATREAKALKTAGQGRLLKYLHLYTSLGAQGEAVKVVQGT